MFVYEPQGNMRRIAGGRKAYPWRPIGKDGRYRACTINGVTHYRHRLIFQWHHGYVPLMVDHRDGDTLNDKICNLRECTNALNQYNGPIK